MQKKYLSLIILTVLFSACGSKQVYSSNNVAAQAVLYQNPQTYGATIPHMPKRVVALSASINVDVDKVTQAEKELNQLVKSLSGYIENARLSENGHYYAQIKVPSSQLNIALEKIAALGEKTSQSINKQDITNSFINNEERLKNLKLFRDKMKKLLDKTTKINDILRIEQELNRVQTEIDMIERHIKSMQGSVDMSPINVNFEEKTIYGPIGYIGNGLWWAVKKLFIIR